MNATSEYDFTIIVPLYNEQDNVPALEKRLAAYLPVCPMKACVLFVNDGSTDGSLGGLLEICSRNKDFYYIDFKANYGLSAALAAGFEAAQSKYCGYMDADLQTAPEDFDILLEKIPDYSMVTGIRADRKDTAFKRLQSKIANSFRRSMTGDGAVDTGCPLKVFHTDVVKRIPPFKGMHRFLPALVLMQGLNYAQVPVRHFPRTAGLSKYGLRGRFLGPLADCFAYRWMKKRYTSYSIKSDNI